MTQVTEEEKSARAQLFVVPAEEKDSTERAKTLKYMRFAPFLGILVAVVLILVWVVPYMISK